MSCLFQNILVPHLTFCSEGGCSERFLTWCLENGMPVSAVRSTPLGFCAVIPASQYRFLRAPARRYGCRLRLVRREGLWFRLHRLRRHGWALAGLVLGAALAAAAGETVWNVEYLGVDSARRQQISDLLFSRGICQGGSVTDAALRAAETELMLRVDGCASIVLNYGKGKLLVEARPATPPPAMHLPQNWEILAAETGVVRSVEVFSGVGRVRPGQLVHKGEVLVSTGWQGQKNELHLVPCRARVVAYLEKELTTACPLKQEKEQIRRLKTDGLALVFGGRTFWLRRQRDPQSLPRQQGVRLLGAALPLTVWRSVHAEKETVCRTLTVQQAKESCIRTLNALLYERFPAIEILDREYSWSCSGGTVYCTMHLRACADIAALPALPERASDAV